MEKKRRVLAVIMTVFMVITMLPSMVFATPSGEMGGKLKILGYPVVGTTLKADFGKVTPEGIKGDDVSYKWSRKISEEEVKELGTEKEYKVSEEDLGYKLVLEVTGKADLGLTGSLKAVTTEVTDTKEEAKALVDAEVAEKGESVITPEPEVEEELNVEEAQLEETPEDEWEETPQEEALLEEVQVEELSQEEAQTEEAPQEEVQAPEDAEIEGTLQEEESTETESTDDTEIDVTISEELNGDESAQTDDMTYAAEVIVSEDTGIVNLGTVVKGKEKDSAGVVKIKNTGTGELNFDQIQPEHFMVMDFEKPLLPGEETDAWVQPREGLEPGDYLDTITYTTKEGVQVSYQVQMKLEAAPEAPAEIVAVSLSPEKVSYDSLKEGYEGAEPVTVTVTNTGNVTVALEQPVCEFFELGALSGAEMAPGERVTFTAVPVAGLTAGTYEEKILIFQKDQKEKALAELPATIQVSQAEVSKLTIAPDALSFGEVEAGYEAAPVKQLVTLTNEGNTRITLEKPDSEYFRTGNPSMDVLEPGESCTVAIRPKDGLDEGTYVETIYIPNSTDEDVTVEAEFTVLAAANELLEIQKPGAIKDLENGVEKSAKGLKLPGTVVIKTTEGNMKAKVKWDVDGCGYDPSKKEAQSFVVKGKVVLPDSVTDPQGIGNVTSVKVSVKAAYVPYMADPANNKIKGMASEGYTTQSKISFEALGAGMENTSPKKGDTRYEPAKWKVINTNSWDGAPYTATFGITKAGNYTLKVLFERQKFDGSKWVAEGERDTKQVNFSIAQGKVVTPTPSAQQKDNGKKNAVATGDTTAILPFVIILVVAVLCIAGVVVYKKKKK